MDNQEYTGNFRNKGQSRMDNQELNVEQSGMEQRAIKNDNQEILATLGTKDNQGTIRNGQSGDTGNVRNKGQSRMRNGQSGEWT